MVVFVDTSAWLAITWSKDPHHREIASAWTDLVNDKTRFITSNEVLGETYTRLKYDSGHNQALKFHALIEEARAQKLVLVLTAIEETYTEAWTIFEKYSDQRFSIVDCISFVLAQKKGVKRILTLVSDFRIMGFEVLP